LISRNWLPSGSEWYTKRKYGKLGRKKCHSSKPGGRGERGTSSLTGLKFYKRTKKKGSGMDKVANINEGLERE